MEGGSTQNPRCALCKLREGCNEAREDSKSCPSGSMSTIRRGLMVMSGKGGVGKSTVSSNLAVAFATMGVKVGLMDADIHGPNIPKMLGLEGRRLAAASSGLEPIEAMENLKVVSVAFLSGDSDAPFVWRGPMKHNLLRRFVEGVHWGEIDVMIVDLPPGTGDEPLSVAKLLGQMDGSIIVTTPQDVAILDSRKAVMFSQKLGVPVLGIVENMSGMTCPHCGKTIDLFKKGGGEKAARELGVPFLGSIPLDPEMVQLCDAGLPLVVGRPDSPSRRAFLEVASKVLEELRGR